jgi:hypothetical protein
VYRAIGRAVICLALAAALYGTKSLAQDTPPDPNMASEETPPAPEAPYPNAPDPDQAPAQTQQPKPSPTAQPSPKPVAKPRATPAPQQRREAKRQYPREAPPPIPTDVYRPSHIGSDESYHYGTELEQPSVTAPAGITTPVRASKQGEFFYEQDRDLPTFSGRTGVERPVEIKRSGEFNYKTLASREKASASFRLGFMSPPKIVNNGIRYVDVYGSTEVPTILGDYEWRLFSNVGRFGIKFGSGIMSSSGSGRFKNPPPAGAPARITDVAEEKFTFITFPNQLTASYKFQYTSKQLFVPYVEGGAGYFTFIEIRDDDKPPKFGGAAVTSAAGGLNFLLDWLDPKAVRQLDLEYGINHVYLSLEYRLIVGLNPKYDFSSNSISAGISMDF